MAAKSHKAFSILEKIAVNTWKLPRCSLRSGLSVPCFGALEV